MVEPVMLLSLCCTKGAHSRDLFITSSEQKTTVMNPGGIRRAAPPTIDTRNNLGEKKKTTAGSSTPGIGTPQSAFRKNVLLQAWHDPMAGIRTYSQGIALADLMADGDNRLVVADGNAKQLRVYQGTVLTSVNALLDIPTAMCTYYMDHNTPRKPAIAIASGTYIFIYRNLRPYYKFTLPPMEVEKREKAVWEALRSEEKSIAEAKQELDVARTEGVELTPRSVELLMTQDGKDAETFVANSLKLPLVNHTVITCMSVLMRETEDSHGVGHLVVGTEHRQVLILEPSGDRLMQKFTLPDVPTSICCSGTSAVEYRLIIATRNNTIVQIKNDELQSTAIELPSPAVGLVRIDKSIIVACGSQLISYQLRGKKQYTINMPAEIVALETLVMVGYRNIKAIIVALRNGEVRVYNGKELVSLSTRTAIVTGLRFGKFGREDHSLISTYDDGSLRIEFLPRSATLENSVDDGTGRGPLEQDIPLPIPKKTKLYLEQAQREVENAKDMHNIFQRDLCQLRLLASRGYVRMIKEGQGPISQSPEASVRLNVTLHGLGPLFMLKLEVQNTGSNALSDVPIAVVADPNIYRLPKAYHKIPLLVPTLSQELELPVECVDVQSCADIKVFVFSSSTPKPLVSAVVHMPLPQAIDLIEG